MKRRMKSEKWRRGESRGIRMPFDQFMRVFDAYLYVSKHLNQPWNGSVCIISLSFYVKSKPWLMTSQVKEDRVIWNWRQGQFMGLVTPNATTGRLSGVVRILVIMRSDYSHNASNSVIPKPAAGHPMVCHHQQRSFLNRQPAQGHQLVAEDALLLLWGGQALAPFTTFGAHLR